ncbi:MAG TPA: hypothetical protein VFI39_07740 [Gemmatimonadales bacterium]|nr:hypothetical protein [Gemmatimonadales bacterium]
MSDKILDFAAAGAVADREFRFVTHPMKWTLAREAALEAQAQARLAVERVIRQRAEDRWEAAATEAAEMRQRAEAAEAALKAERECEHGTPFEQECPECAKWWRNVRDKLATGLTSLRAEHQRLKDAVVGDAMSEYYAREKYRTGGDPWKAPHQDNTSPRAALAAFEAQHPEVK